MPSVPRWVKIWMRVGPRIAGETGRKSSGHKAMLRNFKFWTGLGGWMAIGMGAALSAAPPVPVGLIGVSGDGQIALSWESSAGAETYTVGRRSGATSGAYTEIASGVTGTTYTDPGRTNGTTSYYVVAAVDASGTSANSQQARAVPVRRPAPGTVQWPLARTADADADVIRYAFGPRYIGRYDFHAGLDLNALRGTPVYAVMAGTVTKKTIWDGESTGGGNNVLISHGEQQWTAYLHLDDFAPGIGVGSIVPAGTLVGYVGRTGASSNHLHFTYFVGLMSESSNEMRSRSPLEILPYSERPTVTANFANDSANTVMLAFPAQQNTVRWIMLQGEGQTRLLDYYDVVAEGSTARDDQSQFGFHLEVAAPAQSYPAGGGMVNLWVRPDPVDSFALERVVVKDFDGVTLLDQTKPLTYGTWRGIHLIDPSATDASDLDGNGLPLLAEYALDVPPGVGVTSGWPTFAFADEQVRLTYRRARADVTYAVEASAELAAWSPLGVAQEWAVQGDWVTAAAPLGEAGQKFLRLVLQRVQD